MGTELADRVLSGDRRAVARALSIVERGDDRARALVGELFPRTGRAHLVGVSGSGGVGKSSLIARLISEWRARGRTVAVVAVDPTSAISGGALLGDRVRMEEHHADRGVFVRSLATRGGGGGLARATIDAARVLDAAGFDVVMVETIGIGQDEVDVAQAVETVVLVEAPNLGDDVQALKAGLLEVADIVVVNKADQPAADRAAQTLRAALSPGTPTSTDLRHHDVPTGHSSEHPDRESAAAWSVPVVKVSAATGDRIGALADVVDGHLAWLSEGERRAERARVRVRAELRSLLREELVAAALARAGDPNLVEASARVVAGELDPYSAAAAITAAALG